MTSARVAATPISVGSENRFWDKVDVRGAEDCWLWIAGRDKQGYGKFWLPETGTTVAHRVSYMLANGEIADGLEIDHLCRDRACVNPQHLEAVTHTENVRRGGRGRLVTECPHGHAYTSENTMIRKSGRRACRTCSRVRQLKAAEPGDTHQDGARDE